MELGGNRTPDKLTKGRYARCFIGWARYDYDTMSPPEEVPPEATPTEPVPDKETVDLALKRYDVVFRYSVYENTIFWTRCQFFLVANAALFGFVVSKQIASEALFHPRLFELVCGGGIVLSVLWYRSLRAAEYWILRWENICTQLEPAAFQNIEVLRNCRPPQHFSTKSVARHAAILFLVLWVAALLFVLSLRWPEII